MRDLNYELKQPCLRNRDGSFSTQYARERILTMIANLLHEMDFHHMQAASLKPKHVEALVERWKAESLSAGTIKNRMTELRWWAEKVAKQNVLARANDFYGIPRRNYVTNVSRSRVLTTGDLEKLTDPWTRMSLKLQAAFGLRREESIKIRPEWADRGDRLALKASWTKGGREREIPIRTAEQPRQLGSEFSIGWLRAEVMQWLHSRPLVELNGLDAVERRRRARGSGPAESSQNRS